MSLPTSTLFDWPFETDYFHTCHKCKNQFAGPKRAPTCWGCMNVLEMAHYREAHTGEKSKIWTCTIGPVPVSNLTPGADFPMREALEKVIKEQFNYDPKDVELFTGWGGKFTLGQKAAITRVGYQKELFIAEAIDDLKEKGLLEDLIHYLISNDLIRLKVDINTDKM